MGTLKLSRYKLTPDYNPYNQSCRLVHFTYSALSAPNKKYNSFNQELITAIDSITENQRQELYDILNDENIENIHRKYKILNEKETPIVFILWGAYARKKKELITNSKHLIIESAHPSPFSARNGFFGSKPFSKTNEFLKSQGIEEIDWRVEWNYI